MASMVSRNANKFRLMHRYLHLHHRPHLKHNTPSTLVSKHTNFSHRPPSFLQSLTPFEIGYWSPWIHERCFCSTNKTNDSSPGIADSKFPASATTPTGEEKSGGSSQSSDTGRPVRGGPISWLSFLLLVATGVGLIFYHDKEKKRHIEEISNNSKAVKEGPSVGKAAIGGPFHLINDEGNYVTEKDFLGKWTLIYFGFTHCPDICPEELLKLAEAIDKIKEKAGIDIVPLFISVDPERDTVEQVHDYVKEFHPKLIGLTGTTDEIKKVACAYRVYYMKTAEEDSDYLVDHSIVMYLMDPDMQFVKFFGKNNDVSSLTDGIIREVNQYKKQK